MISDDNDKIQATGVVTPPPTRTYTVSVSYSYQGERHLLEWVVSSETVTWLRDMLGEPDSELHLTLDEGRVNLEPREVNE